MKATVWSLQIQHKYEETLDVFGSESEARASLKEFLVNNWFRLPATTMGEDVDLAARTYFELRPDESAAIIPHEIEIPQTARRA